ncbi:hypothetical protein JD276_02325 [Leucobacter sp. CSA1]|uniref:Uncharacterized protein n=1 Tax=Leucobacter chromiisoli TaxID=2796471 RepID=A0A934Q6C2_9MICO|nr:hypothetical protein [Leucobacter chromiisoli]MBK0417871.1 hypothetical protein [Leucobacter chromiisoli]
MNEDSFFEKAPRQRSPHMVPWIVVGIIAVVALIISIVIVTVARSGEGAASDGGRTPTQTEAPATEEPEETDAPDEESVPSVDVGDTFDVPIGAWGVTAQASQKFGSIWYDLQGENLVLSSPLIDSLPDSCAEMRSQWGITRTPAGEYEVLKPAERCEAAPEVYDELWGLTAAMAESIR